MQIYNSGDFSVQTKQDNSPVTAADLAANVIIIDGLSRLTPTVPIISEESLVGEAAPAAAPHTWLVDPVDGTKEFIKRTGEFTVNIGLIYNDEPVLGVVAVPARQTIYYGAQGIGAFKKTTDGQPEPLQVKPRRPDPIVAISASHPSELTNQWMHDHQFTSTLSAGSSLKFLLLAEGVVDVYPRLSPQHEWDIAAADALLRAAGGRTLEYESGTPMRYNRPDLITPFYIALGDQDL